MGKKKSEESFKDIYKNTLYFEESEKIRIRKSRIQYLFIFLVCVAGYLMICFLVYLQNIPSKMSFFVDQDHMIHYRLPVTADLVVEDQTVFSLNQKPLEKDKLHISPGQMNIIHPEKEGSISCSLKLFGIVPIKEIQVNFIKNRKIYPFGKAVGIRMDTRGVLVLGTGKICQKEETELEPALGIVETGDYIEAVNDTKVENVAGLQRAIENAKDEDLAFCIRRGNKRIRRNVKAVRNSEGFFQAGIWVRDSTQGIGTLTFLDQNGDFGALGHGITDIDTGLRMDIRRGEIYHADILGIVKGKDGNPGELIGQMKDAEADEIGRIEKNTQTGIFGSCDEAFVEDLVRSGSLKSYPIALKQDIRQGKAELLCQIGTQIKLYEIEIERVNEASEEETRGMVIHIVDKKLLGKTNGIIQGMSGSPILQDGKIVGAVTHVFVNDPTRGYGIFIEEMLQE